ncbi:hypothetical protein RHMOL_Rhmol05G0159600 [Rhododendron molle]|uniref:Uncharacterized protein n=1 Tax=Rhododendron molle TaxID=49168 RepID=A0ACC0NQT7_RHOML|nr:hypothetical protein RHMOL_Rhmol05G0159600 [Rhododendron molle]
MSRVSISVPGILDPVRPYSFRHHTWRWIRGFPVHFRAFRTPFVPFPASHHKVDPWLSSYRSIILN